MRHLTRIAAMLLLATALPLSADDGKTAGEHVDDAWIHTKVKANLATNRGASVNIEVYNGVVQLAAFTTDASLKDRLPREAASIVGVKKVINQIYVVEGGRSAGTRLDDGVMATKVKAAMADADADDAWDINVEVNRGVVLLSGFVDKPSDRDEAIAAAGTVTGVKRVINGMNLKPEA